MRRRNRAKPHHPQPHRPHARRRSQRRRRQLHSMLLAGATFFVPHAGKPPASRPIAAGAVSRVMHTPVGTVTTRTDFRLPGYAFDGLIREAAERYGLAPALIRAVIEAESAFDPRAESRAGAQGLMQLMPALATELGVADAFDPRENIMAGTRYLSGLLADHHGNLELALASYNAGPATVERYQGMPPYKETQRYVRTITRLLAGGRVFGD